MFLDAVYARISTDRWKVNSGNRFQEAATLHFLRCGSHASPSVPLQKQHFGPFQVLWIEEGCQRQRKMLTMRESMHFTAGEKVLTVKQVEEHNEEYIEEHDVPK